MARMRGQGLAHDCELQLRILNRTSSGGHKFKVRTITVGTGSYGLKKDSARGDAI